jgi:hypothetical protein
LSYTQPFFAFVIFQVSSHVFAWGWLQIMFLLLTASHIAGITGLHHHA